MSHTTVTALPTLHAVPQWSWAYPVLLKNVGEHPVGDHHWDGSFGGNGVISGVTKKQGLPTSLTVVLFERTSMKALRRTISGPDGSYSFQKLNETLKYLIVCRETGVPEVDAQAHDYIETAP